MNAITFPARPVNGGPLDLARPKRGRWIYEPKFNGWRALVHTPSGTMFNRHGEPLSIARDFRAVLDGLADCAIEWLDCEALERRHKLGQGSLVVLDYITTGTKYVYGERRQQLFEKLSRLPIFGTYDFEKDLPPANRLLLIEKTYADDQPEPMRPLAGWKRLQHLNREMICPFFEGLVAKNELSTYPVQRNSSKWEFTGWMKHRWEF